MKNSIVTVSILLVIFTGVNCLTCLSGYPTTCGFGCNLMEFYDTEENSNLTLWIDIDTGCHVTSFELINNFGVTDAGPEVVNCTIHQEGSSYLSNCDVSFVVVDQVTPTNFSTSGLISRMVQAQPNTVIVQAYTSTGVESYERNITITVTSADMCTLGYCKDCATRVQTAQCYAVNFGFWRSILIMLGCITLLLCLPWLYPLFRMCGCVCCACCCCCRGKCWKRAERRTVFFTQMPESGVMPDIEADGLDFDEESHEMELMDDGGLRITSILGSDDEATLALAMSGHAAMAPPVTPPKPKKMKKKKNIKGTPVPESEMRPRVTSTTERAHTVSTAGKPPTIGTFQFIVMTTMIALAICPLASAACQGVVTSYSLVPVCVRFNSTYEICSVKPTMTMTLPSVGSTSCMDLKYNGTKVGSLEITFSSLSIQTSLVKQYWTSDWRLDVQAVRRCRGASGAGCNRYSSPKGCANCINQLNPCNQLPGGSIFNYPGVSGCIDGPTCSCAAGSGNACQNFRYSFVPQGTIYQVSSPTSTTLTGTFTAVLTINTTQVFTFSTTASVVSRSEGTYTFNSLFTALTPNYDTRSVVSNLAGSAAWLVNAALPQVPSANVIGDIQAGTSGGLSAPNPSSFIYASNIVSLLAQCDGLTTTTQQPGISKLGFYPQFPTSWAGFSFVYDSASNSLKAPYTPPATAGVSFMSNRNYTFLYKMDVIVPSPVTFLSGGGCFSCTLGSWIAISVYSVGIAGNCGVYVDNGQALAATISLDTVPKQFNITTDFGTTNVQGLLTVMCSGGNSSTSFNISLYDYNTISPNAPATTDWHVGTGPDGGLSIKLPWSLGNLFGLGKVASAFIWLAIGVIAVIALFFIIFKVANCGAFKDKSIPEKFKYAFGKRSESDSQPLVEKD